MQIENSMLNISDKQFDRLIDGINCYKSNCNECDDMDCPSRVSKCADLALDAVILAMARPPR